MKAAGVIFDLDGVLCSTDEYHYQAWKRIADSIHADFDRTVNNRLRGVSRMESLEIILEKYNGPVLGIEQKECLADEKNRLYRGRLEEMSPSDVPEKVRCTLAALKEKGLKLAVGSSSKNTPLILEQSGLKCYFDAVCDGNQITKSKPDPEVFLKAAEMLGLEPAECLVVEDALSGAQAGHKGGFTVVCVGDAAVMGAGDFNISEFNELLRITESSVCNG